MRTQISWSDLNSGCTVGIYGLGREGQANLQAALARGLDPVLVDDKPGWPDIDGRPILTTIPDGLNALLRCDVVVKAPGISRYGETVKLLLRAGVNVVGGVGLWLQEADRSKVLCITGTKGKSTTAAIAGHLLTRFGYQCLLGGNIGLPPHGLDAAGVYDYWVIEVSSYQATDLACSPPVVAVTSLHPDHLPWHGDILENYFRDKLSAASQPGAEFTVVNGDSDLLRSRAHLLGPHIRWVQDADASDVDWIGLLRLHGAHNRRNALIARASLMAMGVEEACDEEQMKMAAEGFKALPSRLSLIGTVDGVAFIDDNLSTNVLSTVAAVQAFPDRRVALIVGGQSRGINYWPLGIALRSRVTGLLLVTVPDNGPDIRHQVDAADPGNYVKTLNARDLMEAVRYGYQWARPDGIVLLSPAAPSFGQFRDYHERGAVFAAAMEACRSYPRSI